jgi:ribonuclease HII
MLIVAAETPDEPPEWWGLVRDSKTAGAALREQIYLLSIRDGLRWGEGWVSPAEIDRLGMSAAVRLGIERALEALGPRTDEVIVDGADAYGLAVTPVVRADATVPEVSLASMIAKHLRDSIMREIEDRRCPGYGFARNVGYGTAEHLEALRLLGPSPAHRLSFRPVREASRVI